MGISATASSSISPGLYSPVKACAVASPAPPPTACAPASAVPAPTLLSKDASVAALLRGAPLINLVNVPAKPTVAASKAPMAMPLLAASSLISLNFSSLLRAAMTCSSSATSTPFSEKDSRKDAPYSVAPEPKKVVKAVAMMPGTPVPPVATPTATVPARAGANRPRDSPMIGRTAPGLLASADIASEKVSASDSFLKVS